MRRIILFLLVILVVIAFQGQAVAEEYPYVRTSMIAVDEGILTTVNGNEIELEVKPYINSGRTMVPLRFLEDALGATIGWEPVTETAIVLLKDKEIKVTVDKNLAYVGAKSVQMDVTGELKKNRVFVPLRFIAENMGARVEYIPEGRGVSIVYIDKSGWKDFADFNIDLSFKYPSEWTVTETAYSAIQFSTPNGCVLSLMKERGTYLDVAKLKREALLREGYKKSFEEPLSGPLYKGIIFAYEKDSIYECYTMIFVVSDTVYSWEYKGEDRLDTAFFDMPLYHELWLSMQED